MVCKTVCSQSQSRGGIGLSVSPVPDAFVEW